MGSEGFSVSRERVPAGLVAASWGQVRSRAWSLGAMTGEPSKGIGFRQKVGAIVKKYRDVRQNVQTSHHKVSMGASDGSEGSAETASALSHSVTNLGAASIISDPTTSSAMAPLCRRSTIRHR